MTLLWVAGVWVVAGLVAGRVGSVVVRRLRAGPRAWAILFVVAGLVTLVLWLPIVLWQGLDGRTAAILGVLFLGNGLMALVGVRLQGAAAFGRLVGEPDGDGTHT